MGSCELFAWLQTVILPILASQVASVGLKEKEDSSNASTGLIIWEETLRRGVFSQGQNPTAA
jgi:hypothetical protein